MKILLNIIFTLQNFFISQNCDSNIYFSLLLPIQLLLFQLCNRKVFALNVFASFFIIVVSYCFPYKAIKKKQRTDTKKESKKIKCDREKFNI